MLQKILQGKASMQQRVSELIALRAEAKEACTASRAGAASSAGGGSAGGSALGGSLLSGGAAGGQRRGGADPERLLQERLHALAGVLRDVSKPEEGERCHRGACWNGS